MSRKIAHLFERSGVYYARKRYGSTQRVESLKTTRREEAIEKLKVILAGWDAEDFARRTGMRLERPVQEVKVPAREATVGELCAAYERVADLRRVGSGEPRAATVAANIAALRQVVGSDDSEKVGRALCAKRLRDFVERQIGGVDAEDEQRFDRSRTSAASTIRQARSVTAGWAMQEYARIGLKLPDLTDWSKMRVVKAPPSKYRMPPNELVSRMERQALRLRRWAPSVWCGYALCYCAGLRAGEAAACRWDWFEGDYLVVPASGRAWRVKAKGRRIRLAPEVISGLLAFRGASEWVIPGDGFLARRNVLVRRLAGWMRRCGWDRVVWPKAAHELRKLAGARWYTHHGLEVAAAWLGDNPQTVYRYYADYDPRMFPEPVTPAM